MEQRSGFERELYTAYHAELSALLGNLYNSILLSPHLVAVSELFDQVLQTQMLHLRRVGELLRDMGASPTVNARVNTVPYRLHKDADSHAPVVARRMLLRAAQTEQRAAERYERLAMRTDFPTVRETLLEIASEKTKNAEFFMNEERRLSAS